MYQDINLFLSYGNQRHKSPSKHNYSTEPLRPKTQQTQHTKLPLPRRRQAQPENLPPDQHLQLLWLRKKRRPDRIYTGKRELYQTPGTCKSHKLDRRNKTNGK